MAIIWLPVHFYVLPWLISEMIVKDAFPESFGELAVYGIGALYILIAEFSFLRREFDPLCDNIRGCVFAIIAGYIAMTALNMISSYIVIGISKLFGWGDAVNNLNNNAIVDIAVNARGVMTATAVFLAPIVEEVIFRGGIFLSLTKRNRLLAYIVTIGLFALYHVAAYALTDATYWIYLIQYIPAGFVLCRCYEKTETIWAPIFLHMAINAVAMEALVALEKMA